MMLIIYKFVYQKYLLNLPTWFRSIYTHIYMYFVIFYTYTNTYRSIKSKGQMLPSVNIVFDNTETGRQINICHDPK